jgi:hypothetical protein
MNGSDTYSDNAEDRRPTYLRSGGLVILVAAVSIALAACGSSSAPHVASLASSTVNASRNTSAPTQSSGTSTANSPKGNPTALLDEWASCMHSHGDPNQADPTVDAYGVITIHIPVDAQQLSNAVHGGTDPCNRYVAAAQSALRAAHPAAPPPNQADGLKYVSCMRANGVPNYPYPTGDKTNFNGTGVDPNSPLVQRVNKLCGKKLGLPAWWINGTGPPGDVVVTSGPNGGPPPNGAVPVQGGNGGAAGNSGSGAGG